jgi:hypothetical protein
MSSILASNSMGGEDASLSEAESSSETSAADKFRLALISIAGILFILALFIFIFSKFCKCFIYVRKSGTSNRRQFFFGLRDSKLSPSTPQSGHATPGFTPEMDRPILDIQPAETDQQHEVTIPINDEVNAYISAHPTAHNNVRPNPILAFPGNGNTSPRRKFESTDVQATSEIQSLLHNEQALPTYVSPHGNAGIINVDMIKPYSYNTINTPTQPNQ